MRRLHVCACVVLGGANSGGTGNGVRGQPASRVTHGVTHASGRLKRWVSLRYSPLSPQCRPQWPYAVPYTTIKRTHTALHFTTLHNTALHHATAKNCTGFDSCGSWGWRGVC